MMMFAFLQPVFADSTNSWVPGVTLSSVVGQNYLAFSSGANLYNKAVSQTDLLLSFPGDFNVDLWTSSPFESKHYNKKCDYSTEFDIGVSKSIKISDWTLDVGVTLFDEPKLMTLDAEDILYSHIKLAYPIVGGASLYASYENLISLRGAGQGEEDLFAIGISAKSAFGGKGTQGERLTIGESFDIVYDGGGFGGDCGYLIRGSLELGWKLTEKLSVMLPLRYYVPLTVGKDRLDWMITAGFSYAF